MADAIARFVPDGATVAMGTERSPRQPSETLALVRAS